jgi:hypothetical protein
MWKSLNAFCHRCLDLKAELPGMVTRLQSIRRLDVRRGRIYRKFLQQYIVDVFDDLVGERYAEPSKGSWLAL